VADTNTFNQTNTDSRLSGLPDPAKRRLKK